MRPEVPLHLRRRQRLPVRVLEEHGLVLPGTLAQGEEGKEGQDQEGARGGNLSRGMSRKNRKV